MRVLLGVRFDGFGGTAVAVALAQDGVHGRAFHLVVACLDVLLFRSARVVGVVRQGVSQGLELSDGRFQLRNGGADVGELDDVRFGRLGQLAELGEGVVGLLVFWEDIREHGQNTAAQRDVTGLHFHARLAGEGLNDGEKAVGRQRGRLVRKGVQNF